MKRSASVVFLLLLTVLAWSPTGAAGQAPSAAPQEPSKPRDVPYKTSAPTRELRLGLVCYGGVSLAVYMNGITQELLNFVVASRAVEAGLAREDVPAGSTRAYYDRLAELAEESGVQTRVVIDSIAGTSAGGINGVILAKALAHDLPQDSLRDLWLDKGDIWKLLGGKFRGFFKITRLIVGLPFGKARPPLSGDSMFQWVHEALADMTKEDRGRSLMPPGHELRLFVTTTDYNGYPRHVAIGDPSAALEKNYRNVLVFSFLRDVDGKTLADQFGGKYDPVLAFAARATSSFPGAFPPINLENISKNVPGLDPALLGEVSTQFFRDYQLEKADVQKTFFIDGGVLDNYPFGPAIADIVGRPSAHEVKRLLLYIQPDPGKPPAGASGKTPSLVGTVWGGLSTINGYEPIVDDLQDVRRFNDRVQRIQDIIARSTPVISATLKNRAQLDPSQPLPAAAAVEDKTEVMDRMVREESPLLYESYFQIRVHSVVEQLATGVSRLCNFPADSNHGAFVAAAVDAWAKRRGIVGAKTDREIQEQFIQNLDLGHTRRQLRFVVNAVDQLYDSYGDLAPGRHPSRQELDDAKAAVDSLIKDLSEVIEADTLPDELTRAVAPLCGSVDPFGGGAPLPANAAAWADGHAQALDGIYDQLVTLVVERRGRVRRDLHEEFRRRTLAWEPAAREKVLVYYLGFPWWDALVYPLRVLGDVGELEDIAVYRVSPDDATALGGGIAAEKLKGVALGHFAAFFARDKRENDYLWGRLDGAERILTLLQEGPPAKNQLRPAFEAILDEEQKGLPSTAPLMQTLRTRMAGWPE